MTNINEVKKNIEMAKQIIDYNDLNESTDKCGLPFNCSLCFLYQNEEINNHSCYYKALEYIHKNKNYPGLSLPDNNVEEIIKYFRDRAEFGLEKYGVTSERDDIDTLGWIQHLTEELMDALVYVNRLKKEIKKG